MPTRPTVTTRDIAERLNLSVSTVGRALAQDSRISTPTRLRVQQTAAELGYAGNHAARMMRGAPSTVVGLVVPDVRNSFYSTAAHALTQIMGSRGYQVLLCETGDAADRELAQVKGLAAARVAGVIVVPVPHPRRESARLLAQLPHVQFLRRHPSLSGPWFGVDDRAILRAAAGHLRAIGHTRIAYLGGTPDFSTSRQRLTGYLDVVGGDADQRLIVPTPPGSVEAARTAVAGLLDRTRPPSAVVTGSVRITEGVLAELSARRVSVPRDLSVVGFGDEPGFSWWGAGLTTMDLPVYEVATACSRWLLERLPDGDPPPPASPPRGSLIKRGSTAPPPEMSHERT
jgi:DNA-binding LacI/PurR family transcriptional regulator